jgi:ferredoxin-NADP reductase
MLEVLERACAAEGTTAFHFEKPSGFSFKAGQSADVTLTDPPEADAEGNTRTFSIASPSFENELVFATRMRDTAFKRSLKKVPLATAVQIGSATGFPVPDQDFRYKAVDDKGKGLKPIVYNDLGLNFHGRALTLHTNSQPREYRSLWLIIRAR